MIARVSLEMALRRELDYLVPAELAGVLVVGSRVLVPLGSRQVLGCVTAIAETSSHPSPRAIVRVVGEPGLVTPGVIELSRWIADYYCCAPEVALKSMLPEAVRRVEAGWRERLYVRWVTDAIPPASLPRRQGEVWSIMREKREMALLSLLRLAGTTAATVRRLEDRGLVSIGLRILERDPYALERILPTRPLPLNQEQQAACDRIRSAVEAARHSTFLLHGVTGSGKTEVYLQAIAHTLRQGKGAIVLVPEIALTPQTVERFKARFCAGEPQTLVAVLHSHLSAGERHDEWHKIRQGRARIAIGARSAVFAPVEPLGLIIVDEEHEHSYKQEEAPRYHARDVAVVRGQKAGATVVLGSATPSLESYYNARCGKYTLLELPRRADDKRMPLVRVVDLRDELGRERGVPVFSRKLREAIHRRLDQREQVMLFLNRRGYATSLLCPKCGYVAGCPNCSVSLTYHRHRQRLACHICGYEAPAPSRCPQTDCRSPAIRFAGLGTERVEEVLAQLFPRARIRRMDSDTLKRKEDYRTILGDFRTGKIDILVGTQMIAKGLHFPNVTLVGIVHADLSLHQPDFRAGERTFQLLTQVAGRAGRGDVEGEVIVQSFTPFHPAIQFARRHDFLGFYEQEIGYRQQLHYPPSSRIALLTFKDRNEDKVKLSAEHVRRLLEPLCQEIADLVIAGPAPAPLLRAESLYRHQLMLRTRWMSRLSRALAQVISSLKLPEGLALAVDVDPVNLV
jgi:primosomal protein N' (replication factor Y)